jgi:polysaccharide transporter, PST family
LQSVSEDSASPAPALGRQATTGAFFIGGAQVVRFLLSIVTTVIVARILAPDDYGVLAMWAPIFAFVLLFQDFGFSTAAVQAKALSSEQSTTLFWINILASLIIALLLVVGAPLIGLFFNDARVASLTAASASMVVVSSLAIQHTALLHREMRFRLLAVISVATAVIGMTGTIGLALYLRNYWALFLGSLGSISAQTLLTWFLSEWRPGRRAAFSDTRKLLAFGTDVAAFNVVNFLSRNADNVLIGKFWGSAALGLYDRSYKLMMAPLQLVNAPLTRVMLPVLSRLRDEPERFRKAYLFCFQAILLATAPAGAFAAAASDELVLVLLGPNWTAADPIFYWLALVMIYQPAASSLGLLFISYARSRAYAVWGIFSSIATVASFVIGLPGGPAGVAMAYFYMNLLIAALLIIGATKGSPVLVTDLISALVAPLIAVGIGYVLVRSIAHEVTPITLIVVGLPGSYLLALTTVGISPNGRRFLAEALRLFKGDSLLPGVK